MNLSERQTRNRWKKRTFDKGKEDFFRRAPQKVKDLVKSMITKGGYTTVENMPGTIYECYRVDVSKSTCEELIRHYSI